VFGTNHDSFVRDGESYADANYGNYNSVYVKKDAPGYNRKAYIKFDFSALAAAEVASAKLRLYVVNIGTDENRNVRLYGNEDTSWLENTITWNNAPEPTTFICEVPVPASALNTWVEFDVTDYINSQLPDKKVVSFELVIEDVQSSQCHVFFASSEAEEGLRPQLIIKP